MGKNNQPQLVTCSRISEPSAEIALCKFQETPEIFQEHVKTTHVRGKWRPRWQIRICRFRVESVWRNWKPGGENFRYIPSIIFSTDPQVVKSPFTTSIKLHKGYLQYIVAAYIYIYTWHGDAPQQWSVCCQTTMPLCFWLHDLAAPENGGKTVGRPALFFLLIGDTILVLKSQHQCYCLPSKMWRKWSKLNHI